MQPRPGIDHRRLHTRAYADLTTAFDALPAALEQELDGIRARLRDDLDAAHALEQAHVPHLLFEEAELAAAAPLLAAIAGRQVELGCRD